MFDVFLFQVQAALSSLEHGVRVLVRLVHWSGRDLAPSL